jgi:aminopeptidase N
MRPFNLALLLAFCLSPALAGPTPGHHLATGMEQSVRERQVDINRLTANLTVDMTRQSIDGSVTVMFTPLQAALDTLFFDAAGLEVDHVEFLGVGSAEKLDYSIEDRKLQIVMPVGIAPGDDVAIRISYKARPDTGLYFFAETKTRTAEAWNYGEGGLH